MPLPSPVGIRDADRPEQVPQPPGDHTEYGDLEFVAPECLPMLSKPSRRLKRSSRNRVAAVQSDAPTACSSRSRSHRPGNGRWDRAHKVRMSTDCMDD
jgi:hypothetical protein